MDIAGKVFIVTGGASGLGEGAARRLALFCLQAAATTSNARQSESEILFEYCIIINSPLRARNPELLTRMD